ncbi:MAG: hypothetical protein K2O10_00285 [Muribaculaceae bacterium]|nr:hypothetical protein [Muribaculaceae bacterium]
MADNYLERKMEAHRAGKTTQAPRRLTPAGRRPGVVELPMPRLNVLVTSADTPLITEFVNAGCRVAFCGDDMSAGRKTAEKLGARFYPFSPAQTLAMLPKDNTLPVKQQQFPYPDLIVERVDPTTVRLTRQADAHPQTLTLSADCGIATLAVVAASAPFAGMTVMSASTATD